MLVEFGFLSQASAYTATIPDGFSRRSMQRVIVVDGIARTVDYLSVPLASLPIARLSSAGSLVGAGGARVSLFAQPDPAITFLAWSVGTGTIWTWANPSVEGASILQALADALVVSEPVAFQPKVALGATTSPGDIRRVDERDDAVFYADDPTAVPGAVRFTYAGSLAADAVGGRGPFLVTKGTPLGLNVGCDARNATVAQLTAAADAIAASLASA